MGGRVYDPIHDVFQEITVSKPQHIGDTPIITTIVPTPTTINIDIGDEDDSDADSDNESTQSEDNTTLQIENDGLNSRSILNDDVTTTGSVTSIPSLNKNPDSAPIISPIRYNRHLKKPDGDYFSRKDLQLNFLDTLLNSKKEIFTNIFKDFYLNSLVPITDTNIKKKPVTIPQATADANSENNHNIVLNVGDPNYDSRRFISHDKLTFSQLYVLCLATSTKSSKILRDKLLLDPQVAFSTCLLSILVNIGRLNTTINFYLAMTSQLRTFHSVPALQYNVTDPKSLQDTPRLKSILKNIPVGNEPIILSDLYSTEKPTTHNVINMLFAICDNVSLINLKFLNEKYLKWDNVTDENNETHEIESGKDESISLFNILDQPRFKAEDRVNFLIWLMYIHLETTLTDPEIDESLKQFGELTDDGTWKIMLHQNNKSLNEEDVDLELEVEFGNEQKRKRKDFLEKIQKEKLKESQNDDNNKENNIETKIENQSDINNVNSSIQTSPSKPNQASMIPNVSTLLNSEPDTPKESSSILQDATNENNDSNKRTANEIEDMIDSSDPSKVVKKRRKRRTKVEMFNDAAAKLATKEQKTNVTPDISSLIVEPIKKEDMEVSANKLKLVSNKINEDRIDKLLQIDSNKKIEEISKTQDQFLMDLLKSHEAIRNKRGEIGLLKIFSEFEDIAMASVIGIRGKKRKKFKDELLGFETDYLRDFIIAKRFFLEKITKNENNNDDIDENFFKL